ncbi:MAG: acetyl-CoA carboxylase biotin carboxylase subunit, partial [Ktedonobacterales bacterium]
YYDPLLAKLICWGEDRAEAITRLRRALDEYVIAGVRTTIPFAQWLMRQPRFLAGDFSTDFIAEEWRPETLSPNPFPAREGESNGGGELTPELVAALAAAFAAQDMGEGAPQRLAETTGETDTSRWRSAGRRAALGGW